METLACIYRRALWCVQNVMASPIAGRLARNGWDASYTFVYTPKFLILPISESFISIIHHLLRRLLVSNNNKKE